MGFARQSKKGRDRTKKKERGWIVTFKKFMKSELKTYFVMGRELPNWFVEKGEKMKGDS